MSTTQQIASFIQENGFKDCTSEDVAKLARIGTFPNATKDSSGKWQIPEQDAQAHLQVARRQKRQGRRLVIGAGAIALAIIPIILAFVSALKDGKDLLRDYATSATGVTVNASFHGIHTMKVLAANRWVQTGIVLAAGQSARISAEGTVLLAKSDPATEHDSSGHRKIDPDSEFQTCNEVKCGVTGLYYGEFIGRLGTGQAFSIGFNKLVTASSEAELWLLVNDSHYGDNDGAYEITIEAP